LLDYHFCERKTCVNWEEGCSFREPEKTGESCLDFDDAMDSQRLRADALKETLG
jgi:hypothetical protein